MHPSLSTYCPLVLNCKKPAQMRNGHISYDTDRSAQIRPTPPSGPADDLGRCPSDGQNLPECYHSSAWDAAAAGHKSAKISRFECDPRRRGPSDAPNEPKCLDLGASEAAADARRSKSPKIPRFGGHRRLRSASDAQNGSKFRDFEASDVADGRPAIKIGQNVAIRGPATSPTAARCSRSAQMSRFGCRRRRPWLSDAQDRRKCCDFGASDVVHGRQTLELRENVAISGPVTLERRNSGAGNVTDRRQMLKIGENIAIWWPATSPVGVNVAVSRPGTFPVAVRYLI